MKPPNTRLTPHKTWMEPPRTNLKPFHKQKPVRIHLNQDESTQNQNESTQNQGEFTENQDETTQNQNCNTSSLDDRKVEVV